jgi:hypothetical protein
MTTHYSPVELSSLLRGEQPTRRVNPGESALEATLLDVGVSPPGAPRVALPPAHTSSTHARRPVATPWRQPRRGGSWLAVAIAIVIATMAASLGVLAMMHARPHESAAVSSGTQTSENESTDALHPATGRDRTREIAIGAQAEADAGAAPARPTEPAPATVEPDLSQAVAWLMANDYEKAALSYAALMKANPSERAYAVLARDLAMLAIRRCEQRADRACSSTESAR